MSGVRLFASKFTGSRKWIFATVTMILVSVGFFVHNESPNYPIFAGTIMTTFMTVAGVSEWGKKKGTSE